MSRRLPGRFLTALLVALIASLSPLPALAAEFRAGEDVRVEANEVIDGDLYVAGGQVTVDGRVNGDLVVAGGAVRITGPIQGSVNAAGGDVTITGPVNGSSRFAAGSIILDSTINGDVLTASNSLSATRGSGVGRDLVIGATNAILDGTIKGKLSGSADTVTINGSVDRDVSMDVAQLYVGAGARIQGDIRYQSANEASIAPAAQIGGQRVRTDPPPSEQRQPGPWDWLPGFFMIWLMPLVFGGLLMLLWPRASLDVANQLLENPWMSLAVGFFVLALTPFVILLMLVTILGIPAGLALLALFLMALYLSQAVTGLTIGRKVLSLSHQSDQDSRTGLFMAMAIGLLILAVLHAIPVPGLGAAVAVLSLLFGLGALWLGLWRQHATTSPA